MLEWLLSINSLLRELRKKAADAFERLEAGDTIGAKLINGYMQTDLQALYRLLWKNQGLATVEISNLSRHIRFGEKQDYQDILERDLAAVEIHAEKHARESVPAATKIGFEDLLHPVIYENAFQHYLNGHYREAVLNSIVAVFDLIRSRTGLDLDGSNLIGETLSLDKARLVLSEVDTESGRNDQKGFLQIFSGAYLGIRNPKAHSLEHDLDQTKAAQYLVFASLLARRIHEAKQP